MENNQLNKIPHGKTESCPEGFLSICFFSPRSLSLFTLLTRRICGSIDTWIPKKRVNVGWGRILAFRQKQNHLEKNSIDLAVDLRNQRISTNQRKSRSYFDWWRRTRGSGTLADTQVMGSFAGKTIEEAQCLSAGQIGHRVSRFTLKTRWIVVDCWPCSSLHSAQDTHTHSHTVME